MAGTTRRFGISQLPMLNGLNSVSNFMFLSFAMPRAGPSRRTIHYPVGYVQGGGSPQVKPVANNSREPLPHP